jgi:hypothetical protein
VTVATGGPSGPHPLIHHPLGLNFMAKDGGLVAIYLQQTIPKTPGIYRATLKVDRGGGQIEAVPVQQQSFGDPEG